MPFTRSSHIRFIKISTGSLIIVIIVSYAIWRSLTYARGPAIIISEPSNGTVISATTTLIRGQVLRANNISLNGKPIFIDELGNFSETLIVFPGTNIITIEARDQFERHVKSELRVVGSGKYAQN